MEIYHKIDCDNDDRSFYCECLDKLKEIDQMEYNNFNNNIVGKFVPYLKDSLGYIWDIRSL